MMYPFGYGDGGGGATRDELEMVRRAECLLKEAEYWDTVCAVYAKSRADGRRETLQKLWKRLLLQEFHDILPGTGIARVHEEAVRELDAIAEGAKGILNDSLSLLEPDMVQPVMEKAEGVLGYHEDTERYSMESPFLYVELDHTGRIWQLRAKENGTEFVDMSSPMNELRLYRNVNSYYDAWEIGRIIVWMQPGKHALLPDPRLVKVVPEWEESCTVLAGADGLAVPDAFRGWLPPIDEASQQKICDYIKTQYAFEPSLCFKEMEFDRECVMPWSELRDSIPDRLARELDKIGVLIYCYT